MSQKRKCAIIGTRKGGRVVDGTGLENRQVNSFAGSNPVPSASVCMKNKKTLAVLSLLRKILEIFSSLFLSIYLFQLVQGDFNFLLLYAAFNAAAGCVLNFLLMKNMQPDNANFIFRLSIACEIISILMLLIMQENLLSVIWLFALIQRFAKNAHYVVYEVTLIRSTKTQSLSSYVAGINIIGGMITLVAPLMMGYTITNFSWYVVFIMMLIDAIVSAIVATKVDFSVIDNGFHPIKFWKKAFKNRTMREAYFVSYLKRLSGTDGVLEYLLPVVLFLTLGTEFSIGNYDSLFSVVYIIMLEAVRILNRKGRVKRFYVPLALLMLISAANMVADFNTFSILLFYFTIKTGGALIALEGSSMIYAVGNKENLSSYTREHHFTWNLFLSLGNLTGIAITYIIYNNFYSQEVFASVILVLMVFFVMQAYGLQRIEQKLQNA